MRNILGRTIAASLAAGLLGLPPAFAAPAPREAVRPDGSKIHWSVDRQREAPRQGILVLAQGSGCLSVDRNENIERAKKLLPAFAVVTVEKYGVGPGDAPTDPYEGCSAAFYQHHTVSQRAVDYEQVLAATKGEPWWNGQLVLFGGSEGGAAVAVLASKVAPSAVVVFSTAPGQSFRETFKLAVPPEVAAQADAQFAKVAANPTSSERWGGNSYRWWADILDRDLVDDLLAAKTPILVVQGERDQSAPAVVARKTQVRFKEAGRCNFTYWELAGYDHQMRDAKGVSHLDEVLQRISTWLSEQLTAPRAEACLTR